MDVGIPQLSMHSIREMCAARDVELCAEHFAAVFREFSRLDRQVREEPAAGGA